MINGTIHGYFFLWVESFIDTYYVLQAPVKTNRFGFYGCYRDKTSAVLMNYQGEHYIDCIINGSESRSTHPKLIISETESARLQSE